MASWNHEQFAEEWNEARSLGEVAQYYGITKSCCSMRATTLRKKGVKLKKFTRRKLSWDQVTDKQFAEGWNEARSRGDVAQFYKVSKSCCSMRAMKLRNNGEKLKKFATREPHWNWKDPRPPTAKEITERSRKIQTGWSDQLF